MPLSFNLRNRSRLFEESDKDCRFIRIGVGRQTAKSTADEFGVEWGTLAFEYGDVKSGNFWGSKRHWIFSETFELFFNLFVFHRIHRSAEATPNPVDRRARRRLEGIRRQKANRWPTFCLKQWSAARRRISTSCPVFVSPASARWPELRSRLRSNALRPSRGFIWTHSQTNNWCATIGILVKRLTDICWTIWWFRWGSRTMPRVVRVFGISHVKWTRFF